MSQLLVHQAFQNAGEKSGLEIWRIEDFEPVPVPKNQYGNFYSGDSYIVLKTTGSTNKQWDIHFWLGSKTSQDEAGSAAILSVNLDEGQFHGAAVQHRQKQHYEHPSFLKCFDPAIRYLEGGHSSGFNHVTINEGAEKRLFQIKGKRHVRVRQVDPSVNSMNKGDCFILDVDKDIYVFVGQSSENTEKIKAISIANQIRDQDHNGRAQINIIDPYSDGSDVCKFFEALGSGDLDSVPEDTAGGDDEDFESECTKEVILSEISDSTGQLKITPLASPPTQDQLNSKECYILDAGKSGVYVWVGMHSNVMKKAEAMKVAEKYLESRNHPQWVHVSKVPEGLESTAFKAYFENWN